MYKAVFILMINVVFLITAGVKFYNGLSWFGWSLVFTSIWTTYILCIGFDENSNVIAIVCMALGTVGIFKQSPVTNMEYQQRNMEYVIGYARLGYCTSEQQPDADKRNFVNNNRYTLLMKCGTQMHVDSLQLITDLTKNTYLDPVTSSVDMIMNDLSNKKKPLSCQQFAAHINTLCPGLLDI